MKTNQPRSDLRTVALTGSSGFLGIYVLVQLIHKPNLRRIHVIARDGDDPVVLRQRIIAAIRYYNFPSQADLLREIQLRVRIDTRKDTLKYSITDLIHVSWPPGMTDESHGEAINEAAALFTTHAIISQLFPSATFTLVSCTSVVAHWNRPQSPQQEEDLSAIPERLPTGNRMAWDDRLKEQNDQANAKCLIEAVLSNVTNNNLELHAVRVGSLTASNHSGIWTMRRGCGGAVGHAWPLMFDVGLRVMGGRMPNLAVPGLGG